ncbi:MAG TPA: succinate dehydrogenase, cytochrome b556 subunit [Burkholderiaceae bacterium]|nr:succinate dehydrogenase, cytochrome b556 subunit [Burkholderiaceae bacterium]HRA78207.1 succinate dehydrogenase, cytochrome b556 subunit [Burkholderiaceae bacterium]
MNAPTTAASRPAAVRHNDYRARRHAAWWAFLAHRLSGVALAAFLPLHFWALGHALRGEAALDGFLRFADQPLFRFAEWGLVVLLAIHLTGGLRLLVIEFLPWSGLRKNWISATAGLGIAGGIAFALALIG